MRKGAERPKILAIAIQPLYQRAAFPESNISKPFTITSQNSAAYFTGMVSRDPGLVSEKLRVVKNRAVIPNPREEGVTFFRINAYRRTDPAWG